VTLLAGPEQHAVLQRIQGLMSLLEGHGDVVMGRAGAGLIPSAERFHKVLHDRRQSGGATRLFQRLIGLEAKMRQYKEGEEFLEAVERHDRASVELLWRGPEWIPTLPEIKSPELWLARVASAEAAAS
jgi:putative hydrolase